MPIYLLLYYSGYLDVADNVHMFCLHYVFKARINQHLKCFSTGWDNHPIRTAVNRTPNQLWIIESLEATRSFEAVRDTEQLTAQASMKFIHVKCKKNKCWILYRKYYYFGMSDVLKVLSKPEVSAILEISKQCETFSTTSWGLHFQLKCNVISFVIYIR